MLNPVDKHDTCHYSVHVGTAKYPEVQYSRYRYIQYRVLVYTVPGIKLKSARVQLLQPGHVHIERHPESIV